MKCNTPALDILVTLGVCVDCSSSILFFEQTVRLSTQVGGDEFLSVLQLHS